MNQVAEKMVSAAMEKFGYSYKVGIKLHVSHYNNCTLQFAEKLLDNQYTICILRRLKQTTSYMEVAWSI